MSMRSDVLATETSGLTEQLSSTPAEAQAVISLREVRKTYGDGVNAFEALKGVNFDVLPGRLTAIVGPSGSGKSTLLNLLGALDVPTSGHVLFEGVDLAAMSAAERTKFRARHIGFVFQFLNLLPGLTCEQNVVLGGVIVGMDPRAARARAGELLDLVGLADMRRRPARKLSGGQMQRVAIARALINDPPLLLADEPTGNLDEENAEAITALLRDRAADGRAVVLVTHNDDLAERYADPVMVVRGGQISERPRAELREMPTAAAEPMSRAHAQQDSEQRAELPPPAQQAPAKAPAQPVPAQPVPAQTLPAQPAPAHGRLPQSPTRIAVDPDAPPDQLIADVAMSLVRQGARPRLSQTSDGRIEIEVDRR